MDTPITISSTLSSIANPPKKISVPYSDSSLARVPISWDTPLRPCQRGSSCTPTTLQKVNNWINSLSRLSKDHVESNNSSNRQSSDFSEYDVHENELTMEGDLVSSMIVMSDYGKSELKDRVAKDELDSYCRFSYDYENEKVSHSTSKMLDETFYGGGPKKHLHSKGINQHKSLQNYKLLEKNAGKSDYDSDLSLSVESEKKKELCSYLQLMKPTDKKTVMILQNRRSVRVKNLSLMQEKRDLEKKLRETNTENINEYEILNNTEMEQSCPVSKSIEEMNFSHDEKTYKWLQYNGNKNASKYSFCFPKPTYNLRKDINNFDDVKVNWFERRKDYSKKKNITLASKNEVKEEKKEIKPNKVCVTPEVTKLEKKVNTSKKHLNVLSVHIQPGKNKSETAMETYSTSHVNTKYERSIEAKELSTGTEDTKLKTKILDVSDKSCVDNKHGKRKEEPNKIKISDSGFNNHTKKAKLPNSVPVIEPQFVIPKPSSNFVHDINDFDIVIKQNRDFIKPNGLQRFNLRNNECPETNTKILVTTDNARLPIKEDSENSRLESKVLDTTRTKVNLSKKKNKVRKLIEQRRVRRSCFKIKLKSKGKFLGMQGKSDQNTKNKSHLISDDTRSLRSKNIENPPPAVNILRNNMRKQRHFMNKKENMKQKIEKSNERSIKRKPLLHDKEVAIKSPLKDTNGIPLESSNNISPDKDISTKVTEHVTNLTTNETKSPKISELPSLMLDIDFTNLSTEHKSSLLTTNVDQLENPTHVPIIAIYNKNDNSLSLEHNNSMINKTVVNTKEKGEFYSQIINIEKYSDEENRADLKKPNFLVEEVNKSKISQIQHYIIKTDQNNATLRKKIESSSNFHCLSSVKKDCLTPVSSRKQSDKNSDIIHKSGDEITPFIAFTKDIGNKSLHKCLNMITRKRASANFEVENSPSSWPSESPSCKRKKSQHSINISEEHGSVLKAFYLEHNLVLCQDFMVSFWTQTALGNVLGAQNMWIHKGSVQRLAINNDCIFKESLEMVVSTENNVAYIELWTKEHQSDIREGPVADVFATVYFWKKGQNGLDKKVLQLENINGFADDVQYSVLKSTPKIIVSWHLACNELENKKTYIHCYQLAADYQTVYNISEFEAVEHYVSSLHNIEGCDSLIMGCGENKITLWNIEYGYVVATIEMSEIKSPLCTLWVKCDRGFLFTLQQCVDRELRLIAIHGMNHSWKKLASYVPPEEYDRLKGVCVENGIILAFYDQGILCWNAQTAETIVEESHNEVEYISGKYVIGIVNNQVNIRHAITHLLSAEDT